MSLLFCASRASGPMTGSFPSACFPFPSLSDISNQSKPQGLVAQTPYSMAGTLTQPSATVRAPPAPSRSWHTMDTRVVYDLCFKLLFDLLVLYVTIESTSSAPHRHAIKDPGIATSHVQRSAGLHAPAHALISGALIRGAPDPPESSHGHMDDTNDDDAFAREVYAALEAERELTKRFMGAAGDTIGTAAEAPDTTHIPAVFGGATWRATFACCHTDGLCDPTGHIPCASGAHRQRDRPCDDEVLLPGVPGSVQPRHTWLQDLLAGGLAATLQPPGEDVHEVVAPPLPGRGQ